MLLQTMHTHSRGGGLPDAASHGRHGKQKSPVIPPKNSVDTRTMTSVADSMAGMPSSDSASMLGRLTAKPYATAPLRPHAHKICCRFLGSGSLLPVSQQVVMPKHEVSFPEVRYKACQYALTPVLALPFTCNCA